jgi:predicted small lipoprotein YifL
MTTGQFKHAWAAALVAGLAACGGDGGGGEMPPTAVVIDITAANRDAVDSFDGKVKQLVVSLKHFARESE